MNPAPTCPTCGGPLIQKNRSFLVGVGAALVLTGLLPLVSRWLWIPAVFGCLTGLYLIVWAARADGRWCRQCKTPPWSA
jgi:hypothetical protein